MNSSTFVVVHGKKIKKRLIKSEQFFEIYHIEKICDFRREQTYDIS